MNTFSTAIEFIRLLLPLSAVNEDNDQRSEEFTQTIRKVHVTSAILRRYLKIEENTESHPLFAIKQQLEVGLLMPVKTLQKSLYMDLVF